MEQGIRIPGSAIDRLTDFAAALLEAAGVGSKDASIVAGMFVENNLIGMEGAGTGGY